MDGNVRGQDSFLQDQEDASGQRRPRNTASSEGPWDNILHRSQLPCSISCHNVPRLNSALIPNNSAFSQGMRHSGPQMKCLRSFPCTRLLLSPLPSQFVLSQSAQAPLSPKALYLALLAFLPLVLPPPEDI